MQHPVDPQQLPEATRKALAGPAPLKLMVARGMAPLPPAALVSALYALSYEKADEKLREAAGKTLSGLPEAILNGALGAADLHPAVLDELARRLADNHAAIERVVRHTNTAGETVVAIAKRCDEGITEAIATNEARLLQCPEIIEALYMNPKTRMSTADRIVELAARNKLTVNIPGFDRIVAALQGQKPPAAPATPEARGADEKFKEVLAHTEAAGAEGGEAVKEAEDGKLELNAKAEKADKSIAEMNVTEKIRTAMLGNSVARAILIRSPNKLVSAAVLDSPKLNDDEIIKFAASRQVGEEVLRRIAGRKDFTRMYDVKLNLVNNPKCPLTESMKFLSHLRESDVRKLLGNKNIPSGLRNAAQGVINAKGKK